MSDCIVLGSGNPHKLAELKRILRGLDFKIIPVTRFKKIPRVVENGRTFEANAAKKARAYSRLSGHLTLADDSGLCVRVLNNRPGIYSARFAGPGCTYQDNNRKLLKFLGDRPRSQRKAVFVSTIALYRKGRKIKTVRGTCHGTISFKAQGKNGFGYDPVFVPKGFTKTFAQLNPRTKNRISHRGIALRTTKLFIKKYFSQTR